MNGHEPRHVTDTETLRRCLLAYLPALPSGEQLAALRTWADRERSHQRERLRAERVAALSRWPVLRLVEEKA